MDPSSSSSLPRIAYSFPAGTFDLRQLRPDLCFETADGNAMAIQLDGRWAPFFRKLPDLGLIMASVSAGPLSMASAWGFPYFHGYPGSSEWICLESGTEIHPAAFGGGVAVVEECHGMQVASFQFFDRQGEGCLKLLITNGSDLDAFESLILRHASSYRREPLGLKRDLKLESATPQSVTVRQLWHGLSRSLPDSTFPGLDGVTRRAALEVAGKDLAWRLPHWVVRQTLQNMCSARAPLGGAVRNEGVFLPVRFSLTRAGHCECGLTFFGHLSQLTLRAQATHEAWAIRFTQGNAEAICMEWYDEQGRFCGSIGLHSDATEAHQEEWLQSLRANL